MPFSVNFCQSLAYRLLFEAKEILTALELVNEILKGMEMLVLSRRLNEQIVFPGLDIAIEVIRVQGNRVRLGISAPRDIRVERSDNNRNETPRMERTLAATK